MINIAYHILRDYHEAEDAVQTALLGIAQRIGKIPTGNEKIVKAYVRTAAKNAALNMLNKRRHGCRCFLTC